MTAAAAGAAGASGQVPQALPPKADPSAAPEPGPGAQEKPIKPTHTPQPALAQAGNAAAVAANAVAAAAAAAVAAGAPLEVTSSTPWGGFALTAVEEQYGLHKHAVSTANDYGCALFCLGFMVALSVKWLKTGDWDTVGYILYLGFKMSAFLPLLMGWKLFFFRCVTWAWSGPGAAVR